MCKVHMLRLLVNQRLTAAVEEIFVVLERTIAEYEEELSRTKEENERQRQLLDAVFKKPQVRDVCEEHLPEQQEWTSKMEEEEPQPSYNTEEEVEEQVIGQEVELVEWFEEFPLTVVIVKSEDNEVNSESEEKREVEPPSSSSTEADGDHCGGSQADKLLAPLSNNDNTTTHSSDIHEEDSIADTTCHTDNTHLKCSHCDKTFKHMCSLKVHMRIHSDDKHFPCSICDKSFIQNSDLKLHMRVHTGEKPYMCSVCGKRFSLKQHLVRHTRIHTGERPYFCPSCNKSFCDKSTVVVHMRRHTGEKAYSCSVCDKRFSYRYQWKKHKCVAAN
nr:zinc finger protein 3 homolog [Nerophis lumbriciformis]